MKYLQSYNVFEYYHKDDSRVDTEIVGEDDAQDILYELEHFNGEDEPIFRSVRISDNSDDIFIIDPKKHERKSAYTTNHYSYFLDNSKKWKDYPKRKNSLICISIESGESYGQSYRVIPLDKKSNWGVAPVNDIWWSFDLKSYGMNNLSNLNEFIKHVMKVDEDKMIDGLEKFEEKLRDPYFNISEYSKEVLKGESFIFAEDDVEDMLIRIQEELNNKTLLEIFEDWLDPKKNDFKHMDYDELKDSEYLLNFDRGIKHELWTDAKCMLVPIDHFDINNMNSLVKYTQSW